jgi:hypothetical protein
MTTPEIMSSLKNPRYAAPPSKDVILDAKFNGKPITFRASANDVVEAGREIYREVLDGKYGDIADYVAPSIDEKKIQPNKIISSSMPDIMAEINDLKARVAKLERKE